MGAVVWPSCVSVFWHWTKRILVNRVVPFSNLCFCRFTVPSITVSESGFLTPSTAKIRREDR
jgi:hypothetical protein